MISVDVDVRLSLKGSAKNNFLIIWFHGVAQLEINNNIFLPLQVPCPLCSF